MDYKNRILKTTVWSALSSKLSVTLAGHIRSEAVKKDGWVAGPAVIKGKEDLKHTHLGCRSSIWRLQTVAKEKGFSRSGANKSKATRHRDV
jgi:hypothetical protein